MRTSLLPFCCVLAIVSSSFGRSAAEEPIFTIQSSSTLRLLNVLQEIGLPDPIASSGVDSTTLLERMSSTLSLKAPSGGFVYVAPERPYFVGCLPLTTTSGFMNALKAFSKTAPVQEPNGVFSIGTEDKLYFKQAGDFLLFCDSPKYLSDAATTLSLKPWTVVTDDLKLTGELNRLMPPAKALLLEELLSMTTTEPAAGLYFNPESISEHLRYGLQKYMADSLFESRSFELALNIPASGEIQARLSTVEDANALRVPSAFTNQATPNTAFAIDFSSKLSEANAQATLTWISAWEKDLLATIDSDAIEDKSDVDSTKRIVKLLTEVVNQAVVNRKVDGFASIGNSDSQGYLAGGVALKDSVKVAATLSEAMTAARKIGLTFTDLKAQGDSAQDANAAYLIDLPKGFSILGVPANENAKLHVRIANQSLWVGLGNESERLRNAVAVVPDAGQAPMSLHCDFSSSNSAEEVATTLPLNFRKLKLNVQLTETGRVYDIVLSSPGEKPTTPPMSAQAATN